jgi:pantetheine-phosphate adenylyltransferase
MKKINGTFGAYDPLTNGHLSIIKRAAEQSDKLYVIISTGDKKCIFTEEERLGMIKDQMKNYKINNVEVVIWPEETVIENAAQKGVKIFFRGIRNEEDRQFENNMSEKYKPYLEKAGIKAIYFESENEKDKEISSSNFKKKLLQGEDVSGFAPKEIVEALKNKLFFCQRKILIFNLFVMTKQINCRKKLYASSNSQ